MVERQVPITFVESFVSEIEGLESAIRQRAYSMFEGRQGEPGSDIDDWLAAERAVVIRPAVEIREAPTEVEIIALLAGLVPESLTLHVMPTELLITGEERVGDVDDPDSNPEWHGRRIFRMVPLPPAVDRERLSAEYRHGMLVVTAPAEKPATKRRAVHAA